MLKTLRMTFDFFYHDPQKPFSGEIIIFFCSRRSSIEFRRSSIEFRRPSAGHLLNFAGHGPPSPRDHAIFGNYEVTCGRRWMAGEIE